ncbi:MAG: tetratricopeptide repeat protein [Pyrinomonadaceae bacterium]
MNINHGTMRALVVLFAILVVFSVPLHASALFQGQGQPKVPEAEMKALTAINAMADPVAKMTAVEDFMKKYPRSNARGRIVDMLADQIEKTKDAAQATTLAEKALTIFTEPAEQDLLKTVLVDAYAGSNRVDDAFKLAGEVLAKNPEDVHVLVQMTLTGTEEAKNKNPKYVAQSLQYGLKAIELIEANKKPANMDDTSWNNHKAALAQLYQQTALLNYMTGNAAEAKTRLEKAVIIGPNDPSNYALLGLLVNEEYTKLAQSYKTMPAGPPKEETLKKLEALIDNIVDVYAHVAALAANKPEYQPLLQQVSGDLLTYYKFRHNNSDTGLQELIDKYKPKADPFSLPRP